MFSEIAIMAGLGAAVFKIKAEPDDEKLLKKKFYKIIQAYPGPFTNKLGKTLKILEMERKDYGWNIKVELPFTYTVSDLENHIDVFQEGLGFHEIQIRPYDNIVWLTCIKGKDFKKFTHYQLPPNVLLIADGLNGPIIVDMNEYPHLLLGGDPGGGKSRLLLGTLTNLIKSTNYKEVGIYLLQTTKNDLAVFKNCGQVRSLSKTLREVVDSLREIDEERQSRDNLIDPTKGVYSIKDYNKLNPDNKLPYIYVVIEEFSFLNVDKSDSPDDKKLKYESLDLIRGVAAAGRSAGVFLITSLQRPTKDSIPTFIKTLITTRVSLRIKDNAPAEVINGNNLPTKLRPREVAVRSYDEVIGYSYTIDHDILMENIKDKIVEWKEKPTKKVKKKSNLGMIGAMMENETN